jgi:hypothetical protein
MTSEVAAPKGEFGSQGRNLKKEGLLSHASA